MRDTTPVNFRAAALAAAVAGFLAAPAVRGETLTVVTTTTDLKAITETVGGDRVRVTSISRGYEDPHFVQAKPSYMMVARKADLWIRVGLELEIGWEGLILDGSRNPRIRIGTPGHLDASEQVLRLEVPKVRVTRELGDVHPLGNPHYWLDPLNARLVAKTIAERLGRLVPGEVDTFSRSCRAFQEALDTRMFGAELVREVGGNALWALEVKGQLLDVLKSRGRADRLGGWRGRMLPWRGVKIVTYHRSWSYFANRFEIEVPVELEPKPGVPPSPSHLAEVIDRMTTDRVPVILTEPFYSPKAPDLVAEKTGAQVVVCANSVGGQEEARDYFALIDLIVSRLETALRNAAPAE